MHGECMEGVWRVYGGCREGVWRVQGRCRESVPSTEPKKTLVPAGCVPKSGVVAKSTCVSSPDADSPVVSTEVVVPILIQGLLVAMVAYVHCLGFGV